jgi:hypothetical protein
MAWTPTKAQLDVIADMTTARMPLDRLAEALKIGPSDFIAWRSKLVAAAVAEELSCAPPQPQGRVRHALITAEKLFQ